MRGLLLAVAFVAAYVLLDWASYQHAIQPFPITPWSAPAGLMLVALMRFGARALPAAFAAPVVSEVLLRNAPGGMPLLLACSLAIALGYFAAARGLALARVDARLGTARDVAWLIGLPAVAALLVALAYVSLLVGFGALDRVRWAPAVLRYWIGDLNGVLVVAPLLLVWGGSRAPRALRRGWTWKRSLEVLLQAAAILLALWVILGRAGVGEFRLFYLLFLPIIWIALRFGLPGVVLALALAQLGLSLADLRIGFETATYVELQIRMAALSVTGLLLGAVVSERERAREELLVQQAALGRALQFAVAGEMSAALAHEVNNPIGALTTYLQAATRMLERSPQAEPRIAATLTKALAESRRASDVIKTLRNVYGADRLRPVRVDLGRLCAQAAEQFRAEAERRQVALELRVGDRSPVVQGDESQLLVVLRNLLDNAIAAAEAGAEPRRVSLAVQSEAGGVRVTVEDSGPGFELDGTTPLAGVLESSKPGGMGLGLAIARRIVEAHAARLQAKRREGGGTRVTIEFPAAADMGNGAGA